MFSHAQAEAAGFSRAAIRHRVQTGKWTRVLPRVYAISGTPVAWERRLFAALLGAGAGAAVSFAAAAYLWGLLKDRPEKIDISIARARRTQLPGVRVHRVAQVDSVQRGAVRVTTVARTIVDLANSRELEAVLDTAIDRRLTTVARMKAYIAPLRTNPGLRRLRRLLDDREKGRLTTEIERRFDRLVKRSPLPMPARQHPIGDRFADFAYVEERIVIELDGGDSHMRKEVFEDDRQRQNDFVIAGWLILRFTWDDVTKRGDRVLETIRYALDMRSRKAEAVRPPADASA